MCFFAVIFIIFALIAIVFVARAKLHKHIKVTLIAEILLCIIAAGWLIVNPIIIKTPRWMELEALGFAHSVISDFRAGKVPPLSADINENDINEIKSLANHVPNGCYEIESFGESSVPFYYFRVRLPPDQCFECMVEAFDYNEGFFALFIRVDWKLVLFRKVDCNSFRKPDRWPNLPEYIK